ncbi:hypothetical protein [Streptomyces xinghaiensis]|uniref:hypothetical protein n=1 Tax=Streptomyces xinghaiensis TaxID=1038928 RepID=UPI003433E381
MTAGNRGAERRPGSDGSGGSGGIPDGLLVGLLGFLVTLTVLVWSAAGLSGLLAHGTWPSGAGFTETPLAMRHLLTDPGDLAAAWPRAAGELSGPGLFWGLLIGEIMVLSVLAVFAIGTAARWRATRRRPHTAGPDHTGRTGRRNGRHGTDGRNGPDGPKARAGDAAARDLSAGPPHPANGRTNTPAGAAPTPGGHPAGHGAPAREAPPTGMTPPAGAAAPDHPGPGAPHPSAPNGTPSHAGAGTPYATHTPAAAPHIPAPSAPAPGPEGPSTASPGPAVTPYPSAPVPGQGIATPVTPGTINPGDPAAENLTGLPPGHEAAAAHPSPAAPGAAHTGTACGPQLGGPYPTLPDAPAGVDASAHVTHGLHFFGIDGARDRLRLALRTVTDAEGPLLVVTSDPALWTESKDARTKLGPTHVYDPGQQLDTPSRLRWSPVSGCETRETAASRAAALLAPVRPQHALDSATADAAETLLRCWLHAAAVDDRPIRQVHRWASGNSAHEPVRILRTNRRAAAGSAGELEATLTAHPERRDMALQLTARALSALSSVHIRNACNPTRADSLALESFAAEGGTLYVMGEAIEDPRTHPGAMPFLTALASNVVEHGRSMAERSSAGRLDPPLTVVLDDVARVAPLPQLPGLLSSGSERGMPTLALLRSKEQARARWPRHFPAG